MYNKYAKEVLDAGKDKEAVIEVLKKYEQEVLERFVITILTEKRNDKLKEKH